MSQSIKGIEGLRILTETTFEGMPDATIVTWAKEAVAQYDDLKSEHEKLKALHLAAKEAE